MSASLLFDQALKAFQVKNYAKANKLCDRVMKMQPLNFDALHLGGLLAQKRGEKLEAVRLIESSLAIRPSQPSALNNIGNIFRKLERYDEAIVALREAVRQTPDFADAWATMALVYYDQDDFVKAVDRAKAALKLHPDHLGATHTLGLVYICEDNLDQAAEMFLNCSRIDSNDGYSPMWYAQILAHLGRFDEAQQMLSKLLKRDPKNSSAQFHLDAIVGKKLQRVPGDAVRDTFDSFASSFDKTLKNLNYRAPELVAEQVMKAVSSVEGQLNVVDLGCGTGLVGLLIKPVAKKLVGVDLSPKMLVQAKKRQIYDELVEMDLIAFLAGSAPGAFQLITCADTLNYLGDLCETMRAVAHALSPNGYIIATLECDEKLTGNEDGYFLEHSGRFVHSQTYLENVLADAGLELKEIEFETLRKQGGKPVDGMIFCAALVK